jgi:hypothetical protein
MATLTSMTMTSIGRQTVLKDEYKVGDHKDQTYVKRKS